MRDEILLGDNLEILPRFEDGSFQMVYIDPPFNTGKQLTRKTLETTPDDKGDRVGFQGRRFKTRLLARTCDRREGRQGQAANRRVVAHGSGEKPGPGPVFVFGNVSRIAAGPVRAYASEVIPTGAMRSS